MEHTASYSPDDNKLRLYPACRLDPDEYAKVKAAGFAWAPKQELFVARIRLLQLLRHTMTPRTGDRIQFNHDPGEVHTVTYADADIIGFDDGSWVSWRDWRDCERDGIMQILIP